MASGPMSQSMAAWEEPSAWNDIERQGIGVSDDQLRDYRL